MSVEIDNKIYYRTAEVCREVGISRNTFFRWIREGVIRDVENVDRRGWRLFTEEDLARIKGEVNTIRPNDNKKIS